MTSALAPEQFAQSVQSHMIEEADDLRKVIVGLQPDSRMADIYDTYAHLYTREQLQALGSARDAADDPLQRDRLTRLWLAAADSVAASDVIREAQDLTNERLAWRAEFDGEQLSINGLGAAIAAEPDFDRRERLYELLCSADTEFAERDVALAARAQELRADVFGLDGEVAIATERMGIDIARFSAQISDVSARTAEDYAAQAATMFPRLLHDVRRPSRAHSAYIRSMHDWDHVYTSERMAEVCATTMTELGFPLAGVSTILADLEDRPDKDPRPCVIPVRVPEEVHLVVRPTGGLTDYQSFLHEAGHALHFGLTSDELPFEHRYLARDNALTEIYSYVVERISHEPLWHQRHFGLSDADAAEVVAQTRFIDASLFRRYGAKLAYELEFWADPRDPRNPQRYADRLSAATGMYYSTAQFASDMDPGLYAADYLRAWRTSEQVIAWLRREHGAEWFCSGAAADFLRELFVQGAVPSNEDVSRQIGSSPDDFDDLIEHLTA